ncbi:beta-glucosidase [Microdochium nivale]|nr:beta-glucosidase [Microdochium nivale]
MIESAAGAKSARYTTQYTPEESGNHYLSFSGVGPSKLLIDGTLASHQDSSAKDAVEFLLGVQEEHRFRHRLEAGRPHSIVIESAPSPEANSDLHLMLGIISAHLGIVGEGEMETDLVAEAVALARAADAVVCCVGNTTQWETEGQDLASMRLPDSQGSQDVLVAAVAAANPCTVVVITTGVPVEMPWLPSVPAVLQAWYAGQETGHAIADVLLGHVCPGGRLPMSWPRRVEDTACHGNFGLDAYDSLQVEYVEGVFVGYRHFDRYYGSDKEVLFPFGFGLSYADFAVAQSQIEGSISPENDDVVSVAVQVSNISTIPGTETIQVYLYPPPRDGPVNRPPKALVAFEKVHLEPGEAKTVTLEFVGREAAAYWDEGGRQWAVEAGEHAVSVATSSHPRDEKARFVLSVVEGFGFGP